jgi:hypothetical protein
MRVIAIFVLVLLASCSAPHAVQEPDYPEYVVVNPFVMFSLTQRNGATTIVVHKQIFTLGDTLKTKRYSNPYSPFGGFPIDVRHSDSLTIQLQGGSGAINLFSGPVAKGSYYVNFWGSVVGPSFWTIAVSLTDTTYKRLLML